MLLLVNRLSEIISLPPQMWPQLCQRELKLPHWDPEIFTNVVVMQLQLLDQTMTFSQLLPSHEMNEIPKRISFPSFSCFETPGQSQHCLISTFFFHSAFVEDNLSAKTQLAWCVYTFCDMFRSEKFSILCPFFRKPVWFSTKSDIFFIYLFTPCT